jgi:outer membrane lipoprotein SlyB
MKTAILVLVSAALLAASSGCVSTTGKTVYSRSTANRVQRVQIGTVEDIRPAVIDGQNTVVGVYGGGAVGAAAGGGVGQGTGRDLARAGGAVAGAVVGREVEKALTRKEALEIIIVLDGGDRIAVVQEEQPGQAPFAIGDRVRVVGDAHVARVVHI